MSLAIRRRAQELAVYRQIREHGNTLSNDQIGEIVGLSRETVRRVRLRKGWVNDSASERRQMNGARIMAQRQAVDVLFQGYLVEEQAIDTGSDD